MKTLILFLFLSITSFAQTTSITYSDLKKMTDGSQREAVSIMKSKGYNYGASEDGYVRYSKNYSSLNLTKFTSGLIDLTLYGKNYEYISTNILNSIIKLGYKELDSENINGSFCTTYYSTNYIMQFCDSNIEYDNGSIEPSYSIIMSKRN